MKRHGRDAIRRICLLTRPSRQSRPLPNAYAFVFAMKMRLLVAAPRCYAHDVVKDRGDVIFARRNEAAGAMQRRTLWRCAAGGRPRDMRSTARDECAARHKKAGVRREERAWSAHY
jgi:hypothetical protein